MSDEDLRAIWTSDRMTSRKAATAAIDRVLEEERAGRRKERSVRLACLSAVILLCPTLLWAAAFGTTPLVRAGYALMAVGVVALISSELMYLALSTDAISGQMDAFSQLQTTRVRLVRQAALVRTAGLWSAPVFAGTALVGSWLYSHVGIVAASLIWVAASGGWVATSLGGVASGRQVDLRRAWIEQVLSELES